MRLRNLVTLPVIVAGARGGIRDTDHATQFFNGMREDICESTTNTQ